jgi:hypothetical protein
MLLTDSPCVPRNVRVSTGGDQQCNGKRFCRQMTSCTEARFYLNVCRVQGLDGDSDGTPCENLCR